MSNKAKSHVCEECKRRFHTKIGLYRHQNRDHDANHDVNGMNIERVRNLENDGGE